jgi:hypothetical protein
MSNLFPKKVEDSDDKESDIEDYIDNTADEYSACYSGVPNSPIFQPVPTPVNINPLVKTQLLCLPPSTSSVAVQTISFDPMNKLPETLGYLYRLESPFYKEEKFQTNQNSDNPEVSTSKLYSSVYERRVINPDIGSQGSSARSTPTKGDMNANDQGSDFNWMAVSYPLKFSFVVLLIIIGTMLIMEHVESARNELIEKKMIEKKDCEIKYLENSCDKDISLIPHLCESWKKCKDADPRMKVSIFSAIFTGIASTINAFFEELSTKATVSLLILFV